MNVDWKVDFDKNAHPSSKMARRNFSNSGRDASASLLAAPLAGVVGIEAWAGSSFNNKGVRRTRLPTGGGRSAAIAVEEMNGMAQVEEI